MDLESWGLPPVIDCHVHINRFDLMKPACQELIRQNPTFAEMEPLTKDPEAMVEYMQEEGVQTVWAINYCARDIMGYGFEVNEWASEYVSHNPERLKSTGGYDPRYDGDGAAAANRIKDLGLIGTKIHPVHQAMSPDEYRNTSGLTEPEAEQLRCFYAESERLGLPIWFHTGTSIFPGAQNQYADVTPMANVATDYPNLKIVLCHGGRPNQTEAAFSMMEQLDNVWIDVSSMPPRRLPEWFPHIEESYTKLLWGTDWPGPKVPGMALNVVNFLAQAYPKEVADGILFENARRFLEN